MTEVSDTGQKDRLLQPGDGSKAQRSRVISVRLPHDVVARLRRAATEADTTVSALVRQRALAPVPTWTQAPTCVSQGNPFGFGINLMWNGEPQP